MLRYLTAGETHGKALTVIIDGFPAGLEISANDVNAELIRRQKGYGRGARMQIEKQGFIVQDSENGPVIKSV